MDDTHAVDDEQAQLQAELFGGFEGEDNAAEPEPAEEQIELPEASPRKRRRAEAYEQEEEEAPEAAEPDADDYDIFGERQAAEEEQEDEDGAPVYGHDEAIEENDTLKNALKASKRKKVEEDPQHIRSIVDAFCKQMEIAAEMDMQDHNSGKIAMAKLRMIEQVDAFCAKKHYREQLISSKVTSGMKAWLSPYHDGTLPHVKVRTAVLRNLAKLDLDTGDEDVKQLLKETQVGHYVMFLSKNGDETIENRRLAGQLVQRWAKPLYVEDLEIKKDREAARLRHYQDRRRKEVAGRDAASQQPAAAAAPGQAGLKPGDPGFRNHAIIPKASRLDYVAVPESTAQEKQSAVVKNDALARKMREVNKKSKGAAARAAKPSVEGRGILM